MHIPYKTILHYLEYCCLNARPNQSWSRGLDIAIRALKLPIATNQTIAFIPKEKERVRSGFRKTTQRKSTFRVQY